MHHLHCAAHILLGFHTYVVSLLKEFMPNQDKKHPLPLFLRSASHINFLDLVATTKELVGRVLFEERTEKFAKEL